MNVNEVYLGELLGSKISVTQSPNINNNGITGHLIDETRNMMVINTGKRKSRIPKRGTLFKIQVNGSSYTIDGDIILMKPEDRTKEKRRIYKKLRGMDRNEKHRNRC